jgi:hypothetical protein
MRDAISAILALAAGGPLDRHGHRDGRHGRRAQRKRRARPVAGIAFAGIAFIRAAIIRLLPRESESFAARRPWPPRAVRGAGRARIA